MRDLENDRTTYILDRRTDHQEPLTGRLALDLKAAIPNTLAWSMDR